MPINHDTYDLFDREGWLLLAEIFEFYASRYRARGDERAAWMAHRLAETSDDVPAQLMLEFQDLLKVTYPDGQSVAELIGDQMMKSLAYGYSPDNAASFVLEFIRRGTGARAQ
jgi:hypothetical protein